MNPAAVGELVQQQTPDSDAAPFQIENLEGRRDAEAAALYTRAFADDPLFTYIQPDPVRRVQLMPHLFLPVLRACRRRGAVEGVVTAAESGKLLASACWLAPGNSDPGLLEWLRAGLWDVYWRIGWPGWRRFAVKESWFERHHRMDMPDRHWYLLLLAVAPECQGQGVGGRLLAPRLASADAEGVPCYLETESERNVRFYKRQGFRVLREGTLTKNGPRVWTMRRDPQPVKASQQAD